MEYTLIPLLPFAAFLILGLFGHWIKDKAHLVAVPAVVVSLILSVLAFVYWLGWQGARADFADYRTKMAERTAKVADLATKAAELARKTAAVQINTPKLTTAGSIVTPQSAALRERTRQAWRRRA